MYNFDSATPLTEAATSYRSPEGSSSDSTGSFGSGYAHQLLQLVRDDVGTTMCIVKEYVLGQSGVAARYSTRAPDQLQVDFPDLFAMPLDNQKLTSPEWQKLVRNACPGYREALLTNSARALAVMAKNGQAEALVGFINDFVQHLESGQLHQELQNFSHDPIYRAWLEIITRGQDNAEVTKQMLGVLYLHTIPTIVALLIAHGYHNQVPYFIEALQRSSVAELVDAQKRMTSRYAQLPLKAMPSVTANRSPGLKYLTNIYNRHIEELKWKDSILYTNLYEWAIYVAILWDVQRLQGFITNLWQTAQVNRVALLHCPRYDSAVTTKDGVRKLLGLNQSQMINEQFPIKCRLMRAQFARPLHYFQGLRLNEFSPSLPDPPY
ncbi:hypothetical protein H4R34_000018 [Dimargaris verticillata]|uniref:Uncharacterized protein n=1 Tax=Dimargaris verticillata TaxID=2761393 RepID=A0A9W8EFR5_9FUNG|nr:hypothetical protein H4R34_000018 [Dimargaris verticillata]